MNDTAARAAKARLRRKLLIGVGVLAGLAVLNHFRQNVVGAFAARGTSGDMSTDYPLRFEFEDTTACELPKGTPAWRASGNGLMSVGVVMLGKGFCPRLKIREIRVVAGDEVRDASEEKRRLAGEYLVRYLNRDITLYPGKVAECVMPARTQVLLPETSWQSNRDDASVMVPYFQDGPCPKLRGAERGYSVPRVAIQ